MRSSTSIDINITLAKAIDSVMRAKERSHLKAGAGISSKVELFMHFVNPISVGGGASDAPPPPVVFL